MRSQLLTALFSTLCLTHAVQAEIFIESVFPPALQRGEVNRIELRGSGLEGALGLWTTLPTPTVTVQQVAESTADRAVFELDLSPQAPLGLYGLRLATRDGLSNVHLFAIDDMRAFAEAETVQGRPNNRVEAAQIITLPAAVYGTCTEADMDYFAIDVQQGQRVALEAVGNRLGKGLDPVITLFDERGNFVTERDNDVGLFFDCRFEHTFAQAGRYYLRLQDTRFAGSQHWTYLLRIGSFSVARMGLPSTGQPGAWVSVRFPQSPTAPQQVLFPAAAESPRFFFELRGPEHDSPVWLPLSVSEFENVLESEPNETATEPNRVRIPCNIHGSLDHPHDSDFFALELKRGQRITLRSDTRDMGSAADLEVSIIGPAGETLKTVDDTGFDDASVSFNAVADGRHLVRVLDVVRKYGPEFVYRLEVKERSASLSLTSELARLAIPQGSWQPLPLELSYTDFSGPVELSLLGAPVGLELRETTVAAGTKQFSAALVCGSVISPGVHTVQVVASASKGKQQLRAVAQTRPLVDRLPTGRGPHGEPFELREAQRRLPPSVTDRIAVVVLPAAPFDFQVTPPEVILPRYARATFQLETERTQGFASPIEFVARGGLLEYNRLQMPSVRAEIPRGTVASPTLTATLTSGVNTGITKHRVTVTGTAKHGKRTVHLTRTFQLHVKVAYAPTTDPARIELGPGQSKRVRVLANRLHPFAGPLKVQIAQQTGIELPAEVEIPAGKAATDVTVKLADDLKPGSYKLKLSGSARIGKFFEEGRGEALEVVVRQPD